jgi:hypothetical protein
LFSTHLISFTISIPAGQDAAKVKKETLDQLENPAGTSPSVNDVEIDLNSTPENQ